MANSRSIDKRHLNAWIWERDDVVLNRVASENDMTKTELVEYLISQLTKKQTKDIQQWKNKKKRGWVRFKSAFILIKAIKQTSEW